jgi:ATP-dependent helicase/nuclease subunit B
MAFSIRGALDLPPAITPQMRLAQLTRLILALGGGGGAPTSADRAWPLAASLAELLDEAARAEIDLRPTLPGLAAEEFAGHWQVITKFLEIVTEQWPRALAVSNLTDIAARQVALLRAEADRWAASPPQFPVWAAGSTGGIGAVARLLSVIARMPKGRVILPGLDHGIEPEAWDRLEPGHPQASLQRLLHSLGATRGDVEIWHGESAVSETRAGVLNLALRPAEFLPDWRDAPPAPLPGVSLLTPNDPQQEAIAIAIALREGLNQPGQRVALITPDRTLATRVAAELARFGIVADDSAGEELSTTPPGLFLRLLVEAVRTGLAPVALLALLKHPLAAFGMAPAACRQAARSLEKSCLRGPAPAPGIEGLRRHLRRPNHRADEIAEALLDRLEPILAPLGALFAAATAKPGAFLSQLIHTAEAAAASDETPGAALLWALEEGEVVAMALAELRPAFAELPPQDIGALPGLFAAALAGQRVRSRRALRGREAGALHPRVFIWGLLEARLQTADLVVLGGLTEGVWPPAADPGPWMNRPMRQAAGLPSPEEPVEQAAHDFVMAACSAPRVVLSVPARRDGAPAVPARWMTRLVALLRGWNQTLPAHPALGWARQIDHAPSIAKRPKPEPRPPVEKRPIKLSVSDVELWFNDPYGLYAKQILGLRRLDPLEQSADHADFGNLVHAALAQFYRQVGDVWPEDAAQQLEATLFQAFETDALRPAIVNWWKPRLTRIAGFIDDAERRRREASPITARWFEQDGKRLLDPLFTLICRADRIERLGEDVFAIIDYKTGTAPAASKVEQGLAPQLPLEAMLLQLGGFGPETQGEVHELAYWKLSGGSTPGEVISLWGKKNGDQRAATEHAIEEAHMALLDQIRRYQNPDQPYRSAPDPRRDTRFSDYLQLARRAEWAAAEDEEE